MYASQAGYGVIDRELYVPELDRDPDRLRAAGVPDEVRFATTRSWPQAIPGAPTSCASGSPGGPGSGSRPAAAPRATAATTRRSSSSTPATRTIPRSAGCCWCCNRKTRELACYRCFMPYPVPLALLYRWATLAMLAHDFVVVAALTSNTAIDLPLT